MGTVTLDEVQRLIAEACAPLKADQASLKARIFDLENEVAENAAMYNQDVLVFAPQHICNVAAQILLFYCGDEPNEHPPSFHFSRMDEDRQWQFHDEFGDKLNGSGISRSTEEWMKKFDELIQNRNSKIHFRDWNALWRIVIEIRGLFLRHPNLREMLEEEHYVIQNFEQFRARPLRKIVVAPRMRK
jgi:hypothetical protein